jgi:hypothetical protein
MFCCRVLAEGVGCLCLSLCNRSHNHYHFGVLAPSSLMLTTRTSYPRLHLKTTMLGALSRPSPLQGLDHEWIL